MAAIQSKEIAGMCGVAALSCLGLSASSRFSNTFRISAAVAAAVSTVGGVYQLYADSASQSQTQEKPTLKKFLESANYDVEQVRDIGECTDLENIEFKDDTVVRGTVNDEVFVALNTEQDGVVIFYPEREGENIGFTVGMEHSSFDRNHFSDIMNDKFAATTPKKQKRD